MKQKMMILMLALVFTGCVSNDVVTVSDAALSGNPEAMLVDGEKAIKKGKALVKKGSQRLELAKEKIRKGEAMIERGNAQVVKSRQEYQSVAVILGGSSIPSELDSEASKLRSISGRWKKGLEKVKGGKKLLSNGRDDFDQARLLIRKGQSFVQSGNNMVKNAYQQDLGDLPLGVGQEPIISDVYDSSGFSPTINQGVPESKFE